MTQQFEQVGQAFVQHYYTVFDQDRRQLHPLYQGDSMLTFEGQPFLGTEKIVEKLVNLSFQKIAHKVITCDCQPTAANGILVFVAGDLMVDDSPHPMKFSQVFNLKPLPTGSYYVYNDMFRLNLG
eukprot:tig00000350_g24329.t1